MGVEMKEHQPKLKEIASQCDVCAEFGVHEADCDSSTVALLRATGKELHSVDINDKCEHEHIKELAKKLKKKWVFYLGDAKTVQIPEVEFLFIDSDHTSEQVRGELAAHLDNVTKFVGFHDTGKDVFRGYDKAVFEVMDNHPDWEKIYHTEDSYGLTIYKRKNG